MRALPSVGPLPTAVPPSSFPTGGRYSADGPGPLIEQCPALLRLTIRVPRPVPDSSPYLSRLTFRPFHLQPPHCHFVTVALTRYFTAVTVRVYPSGRPHRSMGLPSRGPGFGHCQEPPRQAWPNRVHIRYGLVVRLRLLSTLPHGNAVTTFDYRPVTLAWKGLPPSRSNAFAGAHRGRKDRLGSVPPPSEPYVRFSRIRLSG
jgi:hypothetical protein